MSSEGTPLLRAQGLTRRMQPSRRGLPVPPAVDGLGFSADRGEVVGLLGLNGAGKSTTLRMLAGTLVPHEGIVVVAGHSMSDAPLEARAALGYLADQPPLYDDMRVSDYLRFCARLRRVEKRRLATRVEAVIEECGLREVDGRRISGLSKGFRQRVGVAQALVHEPAVVLLDEPSNGLDPRQMEELRALVRRVGRNAVVILSSHLLAEVRSVCDRILVMHRGRLVADRALSGADDLDALFANLVAEASPVADAVAAGTA